MDFPAEYLSSFYKDHPDEPGAHGGGTIEGEVSDEGEVTILHLLVQHTYTEMDTCIHMFGCVLCSGVFP